VWGLRVELIVRVSVCACVGVTGGRLGVVRRWACAVKVSADIRAETRARYSGR
jgi:hypothetical protein